LARHGEGTFPSSEHIVVAVSWTASVRPRCLDGKCGGSQRIRFLRPG
jgi:hypothetical protein